jgi:hypothetical protein
MLSSDWERCPNYPPPTTAVPCDLDQEKDQSDDHHQCKFIERIFQGASTGVRPEAGLQAVIRDGKGELGAAVAQVYGTRVIEQSCVFHKLRNVADKAREDWHPERHSERSVSRGFHKPVPFIKQR